jgi:hypothetical protein
MLQNVPPYYSQYKRSQTFDEFIGLEYSKNALSDLVGVKVVIHYIERSGATQFQTSDHAEFWQDYFFNCGAKEVSFQ